MSNYNDLVEFRNKLTNDTDYVIFEEDCQLLDRVLDDLSELERKKQTAIKEFANKIITKMQEEFTIANDYYKVVGIIKDLLKDKQSE